MYSLFDSSENEGLAFNPNLKKKHKEEFRVVTESTFEDVHPDAFYTYDMLLQRALSVVGKNSPDQQTNTRSGVFRPKAPILTRLGTKKTCITNFCDVVKSLDRPPLHVQQFILTELSTNGSIAGADGALIIKGKFQQHNIENVIRKYIKEFIMCHTCKSTDTRFIKENRLEILKCQKCFSSCSIASVQKGFQAQVGKRPKIKTGTP